MEAALNRIMIIAYDWISVNTILRNLDINITQLWGGWGLYIIYHDLICIP